MLQQRAAVGKDQIGSRGAEGDEIDVRRRDPGGLERAPCRVLAQIDRGLAISGDVAALDVAVRDGRIRRGELLLLEAFGGGFTWGSALVRY